MTELELRLAYHVQVLEIVKARHTRILGAKGDIPATVIEEATLALLKAELDVALLELQAYEKGYLDAKTRRTVDRAEPALVDAGAASP